MRKPAAALPSPPTPARLSQPFVIGRLPGWWRSTTTRPAIASPIRTRNSIRAMPTWVRAVKRMPKTAIASNDEAGAAAKGVTDRNSIRAMPTWVRAVKRMPKTAIASNDEAGGAADGDRRNGIGRGGAEDREQRRPEQKDLGDRSYDIGDYYQPSGQKS